PLVFTMRAFFVIWFREGAFMFALLDCASCFALVVNRKSVLSGRLCKALLLSPLTEYDNSPAPCGTRLLSNLVAGAGFAFFALLCRALPSLMGPVEFQICIRYQQKTRPCGRVVLFGCGSRI
ncbi:hypothetical protein, partial [Roseibium sp. SCP14]|uniref:hypothetical protein n=1 Tax=Roseibium sp. SCP14 TaxID=3141375 RepID=UPI003339C94C